MGVERISHYRVLNPLGEGGMGVVYRAHDEKLGRDVALKLLKPSFARDSEHRQRFIREARSAACLAHPFIASIYDSDEADGALFIVMEYVQGQTLRALVQNGGASLRDQLRIASEIAEGMAEAHRHNIIHRDLKPDNVMVAANGHSKILDFGLAKLVETRDEATKQTFSVQGADVGSLTYDGEILGTPIYMSPEQARGDAVDCRSDLFAFGSTLYELTCGTAPFKRETRQDTLAAILDEEPTPISAVKPDAPLELERIIGRCLRKKPDERYNATQDLVVALHDLRHDVDTRSSARTRPIIPAAPTPSRVMVSQRTIGVLLAAVLVLAAIVWFNRSRDGVQRPNYIVVAEFEGPEDDVELGVATRELIRATLEESETVLPISNAELERGRALAGLVPGIRISGDVARELAFRASARAYLEGRVDRIFDGYTITLRLLDSETGELVFALSELAESDAVYIATLDRLGRKLREKIGDRREALQATRPHEQVLTPSLDAYRLYVDGVAQRYAGNYPASNRRLKQALQLDPDFAMAWLGLGQNYRNQAHLDSAAAAFDEARRRGDRLTEAQRLELEALIALDVQHDLPRALELVDELLALRGRQNGVPGETRHGRGLILELLGRGEEALDEYARVGSASPYGPNQMLLANQANTSLVLGRLEEAARILSQLQGKRAQIVELGLPLARLDWDDAEAVAIPLRDNPIALPRARVWAQLALASVSAVRGELDVAEGILEGAVHNAPSPHWSDIACFARMHLQRLRGNSPDLASGCAHTEGASVILRGIRAAAHGDLDEANRFLQEFRALPVPEQRRYDASRRLLEANIAARAERWEDVIAVLQPSASRGPLPYVSGRHPARWLVAQAMEKLERPHVAAQHYEALLRQTGSDIDLYAGGLTHGFARVRLVVLYAKMGRMKQAEEHWKALQEQATRPDRDFASQLDEARLALGRSR